MHRGKQSIEFNSPVCIVGHASVVGTKEGEGPLGDLFDMVGSDDMFGAESWEEAESTLQKDALYLAVKKAGLNVTDLDFVFAGDLLGQSIASAFGIKEYALPLFGVFGACSTCGETLLLGSMAISGEFARKVACVTSSHFASAEKEFRFPLAYGNQRPLSASWTVTGSGAFVLEACKETDVRAKKQQDVYAHIVGGTIGRVIDYGLKDSFNMGACMAPAAADTIYTHLKDFERNPEDYDKIITGDLGSVGQKILWDLLREKGVDIADRHMDCGMEIYDPQKQDTHAGGSGCGCCATTLSALILHNLNEGIWKRVLFVPTGAWFSKTSYNEGKAVPAIAHAVVLESPARIE